MVRHPGSALLFVLFAPLFWIILRSLVTGRSVFRSFRGGRTARPLYDVFIIKWFFSSLFLVLFLLFLILSLLGFTGKGVESERLPERQDLVFAVDISRSMLAEDAEPSRLDRARALMRTLLDNSPQTRFGLVVFNRPGVIMVPVTEDLDALVSAVASLSPDLLSSQGTDIAAGLSAAGRAFQDGERRSRQVVLFSDGEHHQGDPKTAAAELRSGRRAVVHVVALGTPEGAPVPDGEGGLTADENGKPVTSKMNRVVLESIAEAGGGEFIDGGDPEALKRIRSLSVSGGGISLDRDTLYRPFLAIALLFLLLHAAVRMVPWREQ